VSNIVIGIFVFCSKLFTDFTVLSGKPTAGMFEFKPGINRISIVGTESRETAFSTSRAASVVSNAGMDIYYIINYS